MIRAGDASVEWDAARKRWQVRIQVGAEVIKRPLAEGQERDAEETLKARAVETARDEGYELDAGRVEVRR